MRYIYFALTALLFCACASNNSDFRSSISEAIGNASNEPQLTDSTMRFVSSTVTMAWDNGGIAFERLANGSIHGVNLSTGDNFIFDPGKREEGTTTLDNAALWINGVRIGYSRAEVLDYKDDIIWYKLTGYGDDSNCYIVIDNTRLPESVN